MRSSQFSSIDEYFHNVASATIGEHFTYLPDLIESMYALMEPQFLFCFGEGKVGLVTDLSTIRDERIQAQVAVFYAVWDQVQHRQFTNLKELNSWFTDIKGQVSQICAALKDQVSDRKKELLQAIIDFGHALAKLRYVLLQLKEHKEGRGDGLYGENAAVVDAMRAAASAASGSYSGSEQEQSLASARAKLDEVTGKIANLNRQFHSFDRQSGQVTACVRQREKWQEADRSIKQQIAEFRQRNQDLIQQYTIQRDEDIQRLQTRIATYRTRLDAVNDEAISIMVSKIVDGNVEAVVTADFPLIQQEVKALQQANSDRERADYDQAVQDYSNVLQEKYRQEKASIEMFNARYQQLSVFIEAAGRCEREFNQATEEYAALQQTAQQGIEDGQQKVNDAQRRLIAAMDGAKESQVLYKEMKAVLESLPKVMAVVAEECGKQTTFYRHQRWNEAAARVGEQLLFLTKAAPHLLDTLGSRYRELFAMERQLSRVQQQLQHQSLLYRAANDKLARGVMEYSSILRRAQTEAINLHYTVATLQTLHQQYTEFSAALDLQSTDYHVQLAKLKDMSELDVARQRQEKSLGRLASQARSEEAKRQKLVERVQRAYQKQQHRPDLHQAASTPPKPGFFRRHWKKILIGAVVGLAIVGLIVAGIFTFGVAPLVFGTVAAATGLTTAVATGLGITTAAVVVAGAGAGVAAAGCAVADRCAERKKARRAGDIEEQQPLVVDAPRDEPLPPTPGSAVNRAVDGLAAALSPTITSSHAQIDAALALQSGGGVVAPAMLPTTVVPTARTGQPQPGRVSTVGMYQPTEIVTGGAEDITRASALAEWIMNEVMPKHRDRAYSDAVRGLQVCNSLASYWRMRAWGMATEYSHPAYYDDHVALYKQWLRVWQSGQQKVVDAAHIRFDSPGVSLLAA